MNLSTIELLGISPLIFITSIGYLPPIPFHENAFPEFVKINVPDILFFEKALL